MNIYHRGCVNRGKVDEHELHGDVFDVPVLCWRHIQQPCYQVILHVMFVGV